MRICIADDEKIARITLKSMLLDFDLPIETIFEVENGIKMLDVIAENMPDIAFVDIKMPQLNGLEAIERAKIICPNTSWIILSGFGEFDFAKSAIELKVSKYLLKPVDPKELKETIDIAINTNKHKIAILNKHFERDIIALYSGFNSDKLMKFENVVLDSDIEGTVFYVDSKNKDILKEKKEVLFNYIESIVVTYINNNIRISVFNISENCIATICAYNTTESFKSKADINIYFNQINDFIKSFNNNDVVVTTFNGNIFTIKNNLRTYLDKIQRLTSLRILYGLSKNYTYKMLLNLNHAKEHTEICEIILDLCKHYNDGRYLYYIKCIELLKNNSAFLELFDHSNFKKNINKFLSLNIGFKTTSDNMIQSLLVWGENILEKNNSNKQKYIDEIVSYVEENYMKNIGINTIAGLLHLTPNYLSSLFHKKMNMKFMDYITKIRISKAKELLINSDLSIKEICIQIGYYSTRHFTKQFMKLENCYPSQYRENAKKRMT